MSEPGMSVPLPTSKPKLRACSLSWSSVQQARASSRLEERTHVLPALYFREGSLALSCSQETHKSCVEFTLTSPQKHSWRPCKPLLLAEGPMARQTPFLWSLHLGPGVCLDVFAWEDFSHILPPEGSTEGFLYAGLLTGLALEKGEAAEAALGIIQILKKIRNPQVW